MVDEVNEKKQKEKGENTENGPGSKFKLHQRVWRKKKTWLHGLFIQSPPNQLRRTIQSILTLAFPHWGVAVARESVTCFDH